MKKIIIAMAAIAAAFTMASCNKELVNPNKNPTVGKSVITATIENDLTKAYLEGDDTKGYEVFWSEGDKLFVFGMDESWGAEYTLDKSSASSSTGTFIWQEGDYFITEDDYDEPEFEKDKTYVALYPSDIDYEHSEYRWKTEQVYNDMYIPMYGEAECTEAGVADFTFTNLGGLLRLNVKGTATIKSITVRAKEPMSGHILDIFCEDNEGYKVAFISDWAISFTPDTKNYINLDCGENGVELSPEGTDFYISMPCRYNAKGEEMADFDGYTDVTITLTDTKERTCVKTLSSDKKLFIERSKITTASFTASEFKANVPEGALPGKFTVNASGKQVYFTKGNLWADGDNALHFESNQYAFNSRYESSHVSLFTWSEDIANAVSEFNYGNNLFCDENHMVSVDGSEVIYYALSTEEWQYLFNNHSNKLVTVNGVNGCVIAPDGFTGSIVDSYADYDALAAGNLVFLPATGYRNQLVVFGLSDGNYWASPTSDARFSYAVHFDNLYDTTPNCYYYGNRYEGRAIRLVTYCE